MNRRSFLQHSTSAVAGALALGHTAAEARLGRQPARPGARREVMVAGRRVRTIDFHAHGVIPGIREMMGEKTDPDDPLIVGPARLRVMDEGGIDVEVLSINPFWYGVDRALAGTLVAAQNDKLAAICKAQPDRFVGLATVALQFPDLAAEQLEDGVKRLGLRGGSIGQGVGDDELASPKFDPFWAKAQELDVPLFLHPQGVPELDARLKGNGFLGNVIGNPLATTITLSHLIFEGTLDRFPRLKIVSAHGGGYLPSYADRSDYGCGTRPSSCTKTTKKRPTEYLRQLYFDSLVFTGEALRHLAAVCGPSQIVLGTDDPFPWTLPPADARVPRFVAVDHVLATPGLTDAEKVAILGGNAARLLKLA